MQRIEEDDDLKNLIHTGICAEDAYKILTDFVRKLYQRQQNARNTFLMFGGSHVVVGNSLLVNSKTLLNNCWRNQNAFARVMKERFWLVRESSEKGLLTLDRVKFDSKKKDLDCRSFRFALTESGWCFADDIKAKDIQGLIKVDSQMSQEHVLSLLLFLEDQYRYSVDTLLQPNHTQESLMLTSFKK